MRESVSDIANMAWMAALTVIALALSPIQAGANGQPVCEPVEFSMTFGAAWLAAKEDRVTLTITNETIRRCRFMPNRSELPHYRGIIEYQGERYAVPERCLSEIEIDANLTFGSSILGEFLILLRGSNPKSGAAEGRYLYLSQGEISCFDLCLNETCRDF